MKHLLRALGQRNFRLYFIGQSASFVGTWMQQIALAWLVYRLTGSPFMLGLVTFAGNIPILFLAPFGGVWSDRLNRRRAMLLTQALSLLQAAVLAGLTFAGLVEVWHLLAAAAFLGVVNAFDTPLRQAFLLEMVGSREHLPNAIALNSLMMNASRLIGPALAGLVLAAAGEAWCFLLNATSYLAMLAALAAMRLEAPGPRRAVQNWLGGLTEAVRFAWDFAPSRYLIGLVALVSFVATPYASLMPVFARDLLGGDARTLGLLVGASGAGAMAGVLHLAGRRVSDGLERLIAAAACSAGIGLVLFLAVGHAMAVAGAAAAGRLRHHHRRRLGQHHPAAGRARRHARPPGQPAHHRLPRRDAARLARLRPPRRTLRRTRDGGRGRPALPARRRRLRQPSRPYAQPAGAALRAALSLAQRASIRWLSWRYEKRLKTNRPQPSFHFQETA
jgi:MFS family permease